MAKTKTSKGHEKFSLDDYPITPIKTPGRGERFSPTEELATTDIRPALIEALLENDIEGFKEILKSFMEAVNATRVLKRAKISPRTYYDAISENGNPGIKTLGKIMQAVKITQQPSVKFKKAGKRS